MIVDKNEIIAASKLSKDKLKYLCNIEWLEERYLERGMSDRAVGEIIGVCEKTAKKYRILSDVKSRAKSGRRKSLKESWYSIDPHLCYLIGFIFADGYFYQNGVDILIHKRDIILLEQFKKRYGGVIYQTKSQREANAVLWGIRRRNLVDYLIDKWGMAPGPKSLNMPPIPNLNSELMPHFVRGYFDGDGSISIDKYNYLRLTIVSGDTQFLSALNNALPIQCAIYKFLNRPSQLGTWGKKAKRLLEWMWADGQGFHLPRKWNNYYNTIN